MYKIQTLNKISARGLDLLPRELYEIASEIPNPDAIIVRSADMHNMTFSFLVPLTAFAVILIYAVVLLRKKPE